MTSRIAVGIEYDGSAFSGWESQIGQRTVQQSLQSALSVVADHPIALVCAGRTDAGVHAYAQVAHFDTDARRPDHGWRLGANTNLPTDVAVVWVQEVPEDFHARFSALRRHYRYVILQRPNRSPIWHRRVTWIHRPVQIEPMREAAALLLGEHDFSSYRAAACQAKSPVRTLYRLNVSKHGDFVVLDVCANAFLQHMIRNIAGVLMAIGEGRERPEWAAEVLEARDRTAGGVTARPDGLYFARVEYPQSFDLPVVVVPEWVT